MSQASFEDLLRTWLLGYNGGMVPQKGKGERLEAICVFLKNLIAYGYDKEYLNSAKKTKIINSCVNPNLKDRKALNTWIKLATEDLERAILLCYGKPDFNHDILTSEDLNKINEIKKQISKPKSHKIQEDSQEESSENNTSSAEDMIKQAIENPTPRVSEETFEITDEMLKDIDEPQINWDEDFSKRLGLDDDK